VCFVVDLEGTLRLHSSVCYATFATKGQFASCLRCLGSQDLTTFTIKNRIHHRGMSSLTPVSSGPSRGFVTLNTSFICGFRLHSFMLLMLLVCKWVGSFRFVNYQGPHWAPSVGIPAFRCKFLIFGHVSDGCKLNDHATEEAHQRSTILLKVPDMPSHDWH
jgi:hypothetical protein